MPWGLSTQRAVSLSILGLAIAGLCVDRLLLAEGGAEAEGEAADLLVVSATNAPSSPSSAAAASPAAATRETAPSVSPEAARMAELSHALRGIRIDQGTLETLPEAFDVARPVVAQQPLVAAPPPPPMSDPPAVSAVLSGTLPQAIAGGRAVAIGDRVDGWTIVALGAGRVLFEQDGRRVERLVPQPDLAAFAPRTLVSRPISGSPKVRSASATGCSNEN